MRGAEKGFTLLEVLVALAVVGVALAAVIRAGTQQAAAQSTLRDVTLATWVAGNVIEQARIEAEPLRPGRRQGRDVMGHQAWYWELEISGTDVPAIVRLDVGVYADSARRARVADLSGFAPVR